MLASGNDNRARFYRTALIGFGLGAMVGALAGDLLRPACGQTANPIQQRQEMNTSLQQLNTTMNEVLSVLRTSTLKVRIVETDKSPGSGSRSASDRGSSTASPAPSHSPAGTSGGAGRHGR
jgi:gas vesicle protein